MVFNKQWVQMRMGSSKTVSLSPCQASYGTQAFQDPSPSILGASGRPRA